MVGQAPPSLSVSDMGKIGLLEYSSDYPMNNDEC